MNEVSRPPTMGAAIRFMTSEPVPVAHMMGTRPTNAVANVMNLGRRRLAAPIMMARSRSARVFMRPSFLAWS